MVVKGKGDKEKGRNGDAVVAKNWCVTCRPTGEGEKQIEAFLHVKWDLHKNYWGRKGNRRGRKGLNAGVETSYYSLNDLTSQGEGAAETNGCRKP